MADHNKNLILVVSENMDTNQKPDRNEDGLIRMPASTRDFLGLKSDTVEIASKVSGAAAASVGVFKAFSKDIKKIKTTGGYSPEELKRVVFVTSKTFRNITGIPNTNKPVEVFLSKTQISTLLGADPEFLLFDHHKNVVSANNVLQKAGLIGSDGAMIEVRPKPSTDPSKLVSNIQDIFRNKELTSKIIDYDWVAAIYHKDAVRDYPVGGHIHFGNSANIAKIPMNKRNFLFAVINKIIDELLAVPLIKLDGEDLGRARRSDCKMAAWNTNGYGFYGEWRTCDGRLEHRTLSGLWLVHPELAEAVLGTAKAIMDEVLDTLSSYNYEVSSFNHPEIDYDNHKFLYRADFDDWKKIKLADTFDCTKSSTYMASMLNNSKAKSITKAYLINWYKKIKQFNSYKKYNTYIDKLYSILNMSKNEFSKVKPDIRKNWVEGEIFPS